MAYQDTKGDWSQRNQRRNATFTDQHGRRYFASIEIRTGRTCGVVEALYTSPLPVPSMYLVPSKDETRPYDMTVDYPRWENDIRLERREWEARGRKLSFARYGPAFDPNAITFSAEVLEALGPAPQAIEPVIAARQGNRWILGITQKIDQRLVPFIDMYKIDPDYARANEPDFRDPVDSLPDPLDETGEEHLAHQIDSLRSQPSFDYGDSNQVTVAELQAQLEDMHRRFAELTGRLVRPVDPDEEEELADPEASGGKKVAVSKPRSSEAIRKAESRRKKREADAEQAAAAPPAPTGPRAKNILDEIEEQRMLEGDKAARAAIRTQSGITEPEPDELEEVLANVP